MAIRIKNFKNYIFCTLSTYPFSQKAGRHDLVQESKATEFLSLSFSLQFLLPTCLDICTQAIIYYLFVVLSNTSKNAQGESFL